LLLSEAAEEGEFEGALLVGRERGDGGADGVGLIAEGGAVVGDGAGIIFVVAEIGRCGGGEEIGAAATHAEAVDGAVADEGERPGEGGAAAGFEGGGLFPEGHEGIVDDVLGFGGIGDDAESGGVERAREAVVEGGEGVFVTLSDATEEACVLVLALVGRGREGGLAHATARPTATAFLGAAHRVGEHVGERGEQKRHFHFIRAAEAKRCRGGGVGEVF